jgi:hypothetical protein
MKESLIVLIQGALNYSCEHRLAVNALIEECEYDSAQFEPLTTLEEAISLLCRLPLIVEVYPDEYREQLEKILMSRISCYTH